MQDEFFVIADNCLANYKLSISKQYKIFDMLFQETNELFNNARKETQD